MRDQKKSLPSEGPPSPSSTPLKTSHSSLSDSHFKPGLGGEEKDLRGKGKKKVSLTLSHEAAGRLHTLSSMPAGGLALLGVLSGSVGQHSLHGDDDDDEDDDDDTWHIPSSKQTPPLAQGSGKSPVMGSSAVKSGDPDQQQQQQQQQQLPINGDSRSVVQRLLTTLAAQHPPQQKQQTRQDIVSATLTSPFGPVTSSSNGPSSLLQPNVVATTSHAVPVAALSVSSHNSPTSTFFPFSSMTKVALTMKTLTSPSSTTPITATTSFPTASSSSSTSAPEASLFHGGQMPDKSAHSSRPSLSPSHPTGMETVKGIARNMAINSPLLINLLQTNENSSSSSEHQHIHAPLTAPGSLLSVNLTASSPQTVPRKRSRKQKAPADEGVGLIGPVSVGQPKKRKKEEGGIQAHSLSGMPAYLPAAPPPVNGETPSSTMTPLRNGSRSDLQKTLSNLPAHPDCLTAGANYMFPATDRLIESVQVLTLSNPATSSQQDVSQSRPASLNGATVSATNTEEGPVILTETILLPANGQYSISPRETDEKQPNVQGSSIVTEELADEDLLAILEDDTSAMADLLSDGIPPDDGSHPSPVLPGDSAAVNGTDRPGHTSLEHDWESGANLASPGTLLQSRTDGVTFKEPFAPKYPLVAASSVRTSLSIGASSASSSTVCVEVTDSMPP